MSTLAFPHINESSIALRVQNLTKRFTKNSEPVWSNISFDIPEGQRVAIIGSNGAGKSTLLRCCMRLIEPDSGQIHFHNTDVSSITGRKLAKARSQVGFVFQKHNLVGRLSVLTNVLHGGMSRSKSPRFWFEKLATKLDKEHAMYCLEQVNLASLAHKRADELSGGQSQRVAIARALMQKPKMIFADEPVASLDPQAGEDVMDVFSNLALKQGITLVFVTHHLDHAIHYADRVLGLKNFSLNLDARSAELTVEQLRGMYE